MMIKRLYDTLVGATVRANQFMPISSASRSATIQGVTFVDNRDGSYTFYTGENGASATATFSIISKIDGGSPQHVYYLKGNAEGSSISTWYLSDQYNGVFDYDFKKENIVKVLRDTPARLDLRVIVASGTVISAPVTIKPQVIDLTDYFGSTIADYLYNLESATAGSGIAKLRSWGFLRGYQAYNSGSLESVEARSHVMRGFNQWNEEWEVGGYSGATGGTWNTTDRIRSKAEDYIQILPNVNYYSNSPVIIDVFFYDADKSYISYSTVGAGTVFTSPANAKYMRFFVRPAYGTTYNHDICINLSSSRNGEYEAYTEQSYDYGDDVLNGIFKLDANNNLYADGDVKTSDGTVTRKFDTTVINGESDITAGTSGMPFKMRIEGKKRLIAATDSPNGVSDKLAGVTQASTWGTPYTFSFTNNTDYIFFKLSDSITSIDDAKTWLASNPITVVYELATPTTEQSTPFPSPQVCYPDGTEEYVTSNNVPVGHETRYQL